MKSIKSVLSISCLLSAFLVFPNVDVQAMEKVKKMQEDKIKVVQVEMYSLTTEKKDGMGEKIGDVWLYMTPTGMAFYPILEGLPYGDHGMHIHEFPKLGPGKTKSGMMAPGLQAGGHYDPMQTGMHLGPYNDKGHFGDLPKIFVDEDGVITGVVAPRVKDFTEIDNKALIIHLYGDNYSDSPKALGGGARRIAGGIIKVN